MTVKFHEKNLAVYFGLQSNSGSANKVTTASLGSTTAIACTAITGDPTRDTGSFAYLGDSLSRAEYTYEKDKYVDLQIETFQQVLADMTTAIDPNAASLWKIFQVCGGNVIVDATTKEVYVDNATDSPDYGTVDYRKSSPDDATNDKLYKFWDLRGTCDVAASVGEVPTLKFALKGNVDDPIPSPKQAANLGTQTTRVAPSVLSSTIKTAQLVEISASDAFATSLGTVSGVVYANAQAVATFSSAHGIAAGEIRRVRVSGLTPATLNGDFVAYAISTTKLMYYVKGQIGSGTATGTATIKKSDLTPSSFCFSTLTAANFFGFDYQRYLTGCDTGFAKGGVPTDVAVSMLEDQVGGTSFLPDVNTGKFFSAVLKFGGSTAGSTVAYMWDTLQLANVKQGKIASYLGRDVSFRNTGNSFIFYQ